MSDFPQLQIENSKNEKVFVCFFDILGFKEINEKNDIKTIVDAYSKILSKGTLRAHSMYRTTVKKIKEEVPNFPEHKFGVKYSIISDSIIIYSNDSSYVSLSMLLISCWAYLIEFMVNGMPLRGVVTIGPMGKIVISSSEIDINSQILVGGAIIKGYEQEKTYNWSGCTISKELIEYLDQIHPQWKIGLEGLLVRYLVPKKKGSLEIEYTVNWVIRRFTLENLEAFFSGHNKSIDNWGAREKIVNTLDFVNFVPKLAEDEK